MLTCNKLKRVADVHCGCYSMAIVVCGHRACNPCYSTISCSELYAVSLFHGSIYLLYGWKHYDLSI